MIVVDNITKRFGGIRAVDGCSLQVAKGSITGLIGPNGAGKSTLFNIIAGLFAPDHGSVSLDGTDVTGWPAHRLFSQGLARTFQIAHEFGRMTVLENLMAVPSGQLGEHVASVWLNWRKVRAEERIIRERAEEVLAQLRIDHVKHELAGNLSGGQKKLVELARTMMWQPKVVLLDEIGAGVNRTLLAEIAGEIERLNRDFGYTFFVIEHDMDLIARLCSPVIVMAEGRVLTQGSMSDIRASADVIEAYLGGRKA
ncbi:ABC transporter ATP-binding protein [Dongia rigui]|uniref:ABC transporter ATP-binding protein n=1 Tax=Dongia rigui TaxID=940149 RepID=A0ABU5DT29_9PROT|nr:ABC transporter ATP-binding protein [Dongia rigui]MDY0870505.1 ABC transporter ATP-binding protein [Dongia rigui]